MILLSKINVDTDNIISNNLYSSISIPGKQTIAENKGSLVNVYVYTKIYEIIKCSVFLYYYYLNQVHGEQNL